jgi:formylglycine-generating enzyme
MRRVFLLFLTVTACAPLMVQLPAGSIIAGSPVAETEAARIPADQSAREQPQRMVRIAPGLAIQRTEVTRHEFARFARDARWVPDGPCSYLTDGPSNLWDADNAHDWRSPGFQQTGRHPVVCVSYSDAESYARWLSKRTDRHYRLPTGDEWEYAARAGTSGMRWWGEAAPCRFANVSDRARARAHNAGSIDTARYFDCDDKYVETAPVAALTPNPWGLHDILGNVWEWTSDCASAACDSRINRGGSWTNSPRYLRAAARHPDKVGARTTVLGFRLVEDLPDRR